MVLTLARSPQTQYSDRKAEPRLSDIHELVVFCPRCKTLETLWFSDSWLMPTRKFSQQGEQVFHDCGASEPCRLYRTY